jgi:hypothetical protein
MYGLAIQTDWPAFRLLRYSESIKRGERRVSLVQGERDVNLPGKPEGSNHTGLEALSGISLMVALLQSLCTAVLTVSAIRVAIGVTALAAAGGIYAPAHGFHRDAIRIPMLTLAAAGAVVNLAVLAWIWYLRTRPSAQWRRRELSKKQKQSERVQVVLALITLILVGLEVWTHSMVHRTGPPPVKSELVSPSGF